MPEIADVIPDTTIAVEWGNDIRDRTIQRYADAADRNARHPTPTEGDLSYLEDTNSIYVYDGANWIAGIPDASIVTAKLAPAAVTAAKLAANFLASFEVDNSTEVADSGTAPNGVPVASVTLAIPAGWGGWKCMAYATFRTNTEDEYEVWIRIDGTDQQKQQVLNPHTGGFGESGAVGGRRTGMTTTGNRTVSLFADIDSGRLNDIFLYARAVRTA